MLNIESRATEQCVEDVLRAYIECALWASTDSEDDPLDSGYTAADLTEGALSRMREDVEAFLETCWTELNLDLSPIEPAQIGHDFWLTRNHHGAGFWDRGLGELGDKLTELAHGYGDACLYVTDDLKIGHE